MWPSWCHCYPLSLASIKSRLVLPFRYRLTRTVPDKGPLNGCYCCCCYKMFLWSVSESISSLIVGRFNTLWCCGWQSWLPGCLWSVIQCWPLPYTASSVRRRPRGASLVCWRHCGLRGPSRSAACHTIILLRQVCTWTHTFYSPWTNQYGFIHRRKSWVS